jgi:hypothetical protein
MSQAGRTCQAGQTSKGLKLWLFTVCSCASLPTAQQEARIAEDLRAQVACVDDVIADAGPDARQQELAVAIDVCRDKVRAKRDGGTP